MPDASACVAVMLPPDDPENEPIFELSGSFVPAPPPLRMLFADDRAGGNGGAAALPPDTLPLPITSPSLTAVDVTLATDEGVTKAIE